MDQHMKACVAEHKGTSFYNSHKESVGEITLTRVRLDINGYSETGRYYGVGAPLFSVEIETETEWAVYPFRGTKDGGAMSRKALKAELQKLYPNMTILR